MHALLVALMLAAPGSQAPTPGRTAAVPAPAQRPEPNPTVARALEVLDSLIPLPPPAAASAADRRAWTEQTSWLRSLRGRIQTLVSLVVSPAEKVAPPAPITSRNIKALQDEAERESAELPAAGAAVRARHDHAMSAIRNLKA
jgi:hypothetical protein